MSAYRSLKCVSSRGAALLIVLAFVVLLTGLVVAYFSRTTTDRHLAKADFEGTSADLLARSALDIVVADFRQEIANGATITSSNIVPQRSPIPAAGATPIIPNLIRRSVFGDAIAAPPAVPSRASDTNSTISSLNGRSVSFERWNSHYMVPKLNTGDDGSEPITGAPTFNPPNYWAPDWVVVTRNGPAVFASWNALLSNSISTNALYALGRYAFAVYDEGGLLDFNVAGYPYPSPSPAVTPPSLITNIGRKGAIGFADLTAMRITSGGSTPNPNTLTKMVAWRNYATVSSAGTFPNLSAPDPAASAFVTYSLDRTRDFRSVAPTTYNSRTDQAFVSRTELIELCGPTNASFNMLQFLGTFSRERNRPTSGSLTARWPLSRFDLFAATPPSDATAVQTYFGLRYVPAATGSPAVGEHWEYIGTSGSTRLSAIPAASATVDSDLPLLLQSTLGSASTGEILSIVASLIDQRDSNDETTWIEFGGAGPAQKAYGVDNNPVVDPSPSPSPAPRPSNVVVLNRGFRNVGELGYAYRNGSTSLDFRTAGSIDAPLLDLFTYNTAPIRSGIVSLNTKNSAVIAAVLRGALPTEASAAGISTAQATPAATSIVISTAGAPAVGRQDVARLAAAPTNAPFNTSGATAEETKEAVARALAEVSQTRTWTLMIDVIAQTGRYPTTAAALSNFVVEGEKRYWLHIAIDRFTGEVIDQQLEAVYE